MFAHSLLKTVWSVPPRAPPMLNLAGIIYTQVIAEQNITKNYANFMYKNELLSECWSGHKYLSQTRTTRTYLEKNLFFWPASLSHAKEIAECIKLSLNSWPWMMFSICIFALQQLFLVRKQLLRIVNTWSGMLSIWFTNVLGAINFNLSLICYYVGIIPLRIHQNLSC